jgi:hypothetical protein
VAGDNGQRGLLPHPHANWETLTPQQQIESVQRLVARIDCDTTHHKIAITFHSIPSYKRKGYDVAPQIPTWIRQLRRVVPKELNGNVRAGRKPWWP